MERGIRRLPRWARALLALALGCVVFGLLGELGLRWLLFGEGDLARRLGKPLRQPYYWVRDANDDDFWKLYAAFGPQEFPPAEEHDPVLGWLPHLAPGTGAHPDEAHIGARRPILVFGDSFAQCTTSEEECWQGLLEQSELAADHVLINYGIGGYGFDQTILLCERVVERMAPRQPIVVVSALIDDDFERCALSFRGNPKPRFRLVDGELELQPAGPPRSPEWHERNPPTIRSYLARLFQIRFASHDLYAPGWTDEESRQAQQQLGRALIGRIRDALTRMGVERWFVLMFHGEGALHGARRALWQEEMVASYCRENGIPCVSTRPYLEAAIEDGTPRADLFADPASLQAGHYAPAGNRVAFEALLQGIAARTEADTSRVRAWSRGGELRLPDTTTQSFHVRGRRGRAFAPGRGPLNVRVLEQADGRARLTIRPGAEGSTEVTIALDGATRFSARVRPIVVPGEACASGPPLVLEHGPPGPSRATRELAIGADEVLVELHDLDGVSLQLAVRRAGDRPDCAWLRFDDVRIE